MKYKIVTSICDTVHSVVDFYLNVKKMILEVLEFGCAHALCLVTDLQMAIYEMAVLPVL